MMILGTFCLGLYLAITGTTAQGDADFEFFSPTCPVKDSFPGFKFQTISALGIVALANASEDIGTFLEIGCDPNFDETTLTVIETKCKNPIFNKLGISCAREVTIEGYTPLILAVIYGTSETVRKFAQIPEINLDAQTSNSVSPLWLATSYGNLDNVKTLVEAGANLELGGGEYLTKPLGAAVLNENLDLARYLISKGANVNSRSSTKSTPAGYAATRGNVEILKLLREAGADLDDAEGQENSSLLIVASVNNQQAVVDYLISQKVDLNRRDEKGRTALSFAAYSAYLVIVKSLVKAGADLDQLYTKDQFSTLSTAILAGNTDVALFLIQSGADVDTQSSEGFTASTIAAQNGNLPVLEALADAGANLETKGGPFAMTPLAFAALKGHLDIVQYLTAKGVNIQATDKDEKTALDLAREFGKDDVVKFLEEK